MLALRASARAGLVTGARSRAALPRQKMEWLLGPSAARPLATAAEPSVLVEKREPGIAVVTLNRPKKLNALDMPTFRGIRDAALALRADADVRCVVLRGAGRAFSAGLDVRSVMSPGSATANAEELLARPEGEPANLAQAVGYLWRSVPCPVIAAVHGVCLGGGFHVALGADVRIVSEDARFSIMEAKWGLIPDMGNTATLRELVNRDVAIELTTTGRVFGAAEAKDLGLVTRVAPDALGAAMEAARQIAGGSPDAAAAAKQLWHAAYDAPPGPEAERRNLGLETDLQRRLMFGWNQAACAMKGLGAPPVLIPGFAARDQQWSEEAEAAADARIRELLEEDDVDAAAAAA